MCCYPFKDGHISFTLTSLAFQTTGSANIFDVVRQQIENAKGQPAAIDQIKTFLDQINTRLSFEQNMSEVHFLTWEARYNSSIQHHMTLRDSLHAKLGSLRRRQANLSFTIDVLTTHIGTLGQRIASRVEKVSRLQDRMSEGDALRAWENLRYQTRWNRSQVSIQAVDYMVDQVGSSPLDVNNSFLTALNEAHGTEKGISNNTVRWCIGCPVQSFSC